MERIKSFFLVILAAVCGLLAAENRVVRHDQDSMKYAYGSFLAKRVGGHPLTEAIRPNSLAVFHASQGMVACGVVRGAE